jgi:chromosome segregation protein
MFLHRLELQGFKSFADKTEVHFGNGVTGVIGPNGCGKTNVSDAIRWVMGEQSARQLRGDTMEDVIFNGSPSRKPHGMAEVHVTFKNDRGILPTEFSEVMVSRRVFRSGLSEYFINKTPCRLKDIRDLFFDTGMGSHAYSVIERQMVDQVLSDGSGHRRFLFEEAAGITKYKARKKETLTKLDATETDLMRLHDIVFEIERELRSIARQVGKARRYQRLRDEAQHLDLQLTAGRVAELKAKEKEAAEQWQEEAVRREGAAAELDALEAHLNDQKLTLLELERELSTAQAGLRDREEARGEAEHQNVLLDERAAGLERRGREAEEEAAQLGERLSQVAEREREAEARLAEVRNQRTQAEADLTASEAALAAVDTEIRDRHTVAADHRQLSLDLFSAEAEKRGAWEAARARLESLEERSQAVSRGIAELEARAGELLRTSESGDAQRRGLAAELDESRRLLSEADRTVSERTSTARAAEKRCRGCGRRRRQPFAAQTLLELKRNYEGVSEGARACSQRATASGLLGMVADALEVPARFLDALEASLGEASAFLLVEDRDALERSLERLRGLESGRATLIDLSAIGGGALPAIPEGEGVLGRASELVRCEARFRPLVERLLGSVVMVEDRETAARLSTRSEGGLRFVGLDAEVWERGRVRAGSTRNLAGLLHREMEIRELSGRLADQRLAIEGRQRELEDLERNAPTIWHGGPGARRDGSAPRRPRGTEPRARGRRARAPLGLAETEERRSELHALDAEREALGRA